MKWCINRYVVLAGISLCCVAGTSPVVAQIASDGTLPTNITRSGNLWEITGGTQAGRNLFHSFSQFSVPTGNAAYFNNAPLIENIFSRVTGSSASQIDGLIRANGTANLFLLNPNGILFGSNARLDIGGSFTASTSDRIVFVDGTQFKATDTASQPLLTISTPLGVQYGTQPSGSINNAGNLAVKPKANITLLGTTVTSTGQLVAPGGTVQVLGDRIALLDNALIDVSAVGGGGTVLIGGDYQGKGIVPNASRTFVDKDVTINADALGNGNAGKVIVWSDESTRFYGNISARGGAESGNGGFVEVSGKSFLDYAGIADLSAIQGQFGTLLLDPTNITVVAGANNPAELAANDQFADPGANNTIANGTLNAAPANVILQATNNITFNAPVNILTPGVGLTAQAGNNITVNSPITTFGGIIQLTANDATSGTPSGTGSIFINASIQSLGGAIALRAGGDISVNGAAVLTSGLFGDSGNLSVETGRLTVQNFGRLSTGTFGFGNAGNINIQASEIDLIAPNSPLPLLTGISALANPGSTGNAGTITIETGRLTARNGAQISAGADGSGRAGDINVRASEIELTGVLSANGFPTGILADSNPGSTGNAGTITIETGSLITRDGGGVFVSTEGAGNGGALNIRASSIELSGNGSTYPSGLIAQAFPGSTGNAGQVTIDTGRLLVRDRARVTTRASVGRAGNLLIQATDSVDILNRGFLIAVSDGAGVGGDIAIATRNLNLQDGFILSNTTNQGNGGNIAINSLESVRMAGTSFISTGALGSGTGGNLLIETGTLSISDESNIITSSVSQGNSGNLRLQATNAINVTGAGVVVSTGNLGTGTGGTMEIETGQMLVSNQAEVSTFSIGGNAGNVTIRTGQLQVQKEATIDTSTEMGNAGNLTVNAANAVNVIDSGLLSTGTLGTGAGGNLSIATRNLNIQNSGRVFTSSFDANTFDYSILDPNIYPPDAISRIRNSVNTANQGNFTQGNSGNLTIRATDSVNLANSGTLATLAFGKASGGLLSLESGQLSIQGNATVSSSAYGQGNGGDIQLQANSLSLTSSGLLASRSGGSGRAGNMIINVRDDLRASDSDIVATSDRAGGGDINIAARDIRLQDGSLISTSVFDSTGGGGNITINSETFVILGDTDILANAAAGPGGDITINSPAFLVALFSTNQATAVGRNPGDLTQFRGNNRVDISDNFVRLDDSDRITIFGAFDQFRGNNRTDISTASQSGRAGIPRISPINNTQAVAQEPLKLVNAEELIDRRCTRADTNKKSSFVITGRGGLPPSPNDVLQPESVITDWVTLDSQEQQVKDTTSSDRTAPIIPTAPVKPELVEAQGWVYGAKGEVILTASASTATPQTPFLAPPSCKGDTYGEPEPLRRTHSRSVSNRGDHRSNLLVRNKGDQ